MHNLISTVYFPTLFVGMCQFCWQFFWRNTLVKTKQNAGKWAPRNGNLAHFVGKRSRYSNRTGMHSIMTTYAHRNDQDTLIAQSLCTKYSNRAVTHACKLEILQLILLKLSKI